MAPSTKAISISGIASGLFFKTFACTNSNWFFQFFHLVFKSSVNIIVESSQQVKLNQPILNFPFLSPILIIVAKLEVDFDIIIYKSQIQSSNIKSNPKTQIQIEKQFGILDFVIWIYHYDSYRTFLLQP